MRYGTREPETQDSNRHEAQDRLGVAMASLAPQSRRVMELWLQGLTRQEIAKEMRIDEAAVVACCDTSLDQLRRLLGDHGIGRTLCRR